MKKILMFVFMFLYAGLIQTASALPSIATINYTLTQAEGDSCPAVLNNSLVTVSYEYDFQRNMGLAFLKQLQTTHWTEVLHPLGLSSVYGFMSDMAPRVVQLIGGEVVVYRIIFNLKFNGDSQVRLMIGEQGDCIMSSDVINVNK